MLSQAQHSRSPCLWEYTFCWPSGQSKRFHLSYFDPLRHLGEKWIPWNESHWSSGSNWAPSIVCLQNISTTRSVTQKIHTDNYMASQKTVSCLQCSHEAFNTGILASRGCFAVWKRKSNNPFEYWHLGAYRHRNGTHKTWQNPVNGCFVLQPVCDLHSGLAFLPEH